MLSKESFLYSYAIKDSVMLTKYEIIIFFHELENSQMLTDLAHHHHIMDYKEKKVNQREGETFT